MKTNRPNTIDGTPVITSTKYRTMFANHDSLPYSVSYSATLIPIGDGDQRREADDLKRAENRAADPADVAGRRRRRAGDVREVLARFGSLVKKLLFQELSPL